MRHKFLVLTVKELLKSVYIYGSYRKIKTVITFFGPPVLPELHQFDRKQFGASNRNSSRTVRHVNYVELSSTT